LWLFVASLQRVNGERRRKQKDKSSFGSNWR
jgi:hypothetical protein